MQRTCIYCKGGKNTKLSREHVVSKVVYETMFYPLKYIGTVRETEQAVEDWYYWVQMGYQFG